MADPPIPDLSAIDAMAVSANPPAAIREAATVIVLREGGDGVEALLLRRHGRSGFAADAWVFPGGVVDPADGSLDRACWRGIDPVALGPRFNADPERVLALHVAAVRETFEESGLLLAAHADGRPVDLDDPGVVAMRAALADRAHPAGADDFNAWLAASGLVLDLGALAYWARWITPPFERKRFDTRFFLARAPRGQVAAFDDVETTGQRWLAPSAALKAADAGELFMIYPTIKNLEALADACATGDGVGAVFACAEACAEVPAVLPHFERLDEGGYRVLHPDDPDYPRERYAEELGR